jgi:hypothetical protein
MERLKEARQKALRHRPFLRMSPDSDALSIIRPRCSLFLRPQASGLRTSLNLNALQYHLLPRAQLTAGRERVARPSSRSTALSAYPRPS